MPDVTIREVDIKEVGQVLELIDQFDRPVAPHPSEEHQQRIFAEIQRNGGGVIGAFLNDVLIGCCTLNICSNLSWSGRSYAIIENIIIDHVFRGQGIGKKVLYFATEKARLLNCYKVALMTGSKREEVFNFYRSAGFSKDKAGFQIRF